MAKNIRRAAKKAINSRGSHGLLGLVIFDEKLVYENFKKAVDSKVNASVSLLKWAKEEENLALRDVFSKVFEVSNIWANIWKDFNDEYLLYRAAFKEVLHEERVLDEVRKKEVICAARLNKLQRQLDQGKKKSTGRSSPKSVSLTEEIGQVLSEAEQAHAELEVKFTKHEIFKAVRLREALLQISGSLEKLAEKTVTICSAYKKLAAAIPDTPTQLSDEKVFSGAGQTRSVVCDLAEKLDLDPGFRKRLAEEGSSLQTYLYAVSPRIDMCNLKIVENQIEKPKPTNGASPHQQNLLQDKSIDQNFNRPLSLNDLRPPISRPPAAPKPAVKNKHRPPKKDGYQGLKPTTSVPALTERKMINAGIIGSCEIVCRKCHQIDPLIVYSCQHCKYVSAPAATSGDGNLWYARTSRFDADSDEDSDGYAEPLESYPQPRPRGSAGRILSDGALNDVQRRDIRSFVDPSSGGTYAVLGRESPTGDESCINQEDVCYLEVVNS